ncbi:uncharacterized protein LOC127509830 isoform X9 [Ctenopharyngodon idella]|uniref:uncharacterized protein LOC127509830 isoform X9 n=1 Tax=Ctenopharyngodon idella TaxID=7959 RepID=UPI00222E5A43|nr:uncharacterized protein LOC127509830 isoform X9 [Ctenopharyngodon idella]
MKNNFKFFQIFLLMCGVFSAGTDEVKTVMEGDSVTLNPDLTQIQGIIQMKWRFGDSRSVIALIEGNMISYPIVPEMFKDRLKLDQTGSLTVTNMKTKHSGLYKLEINHDTGTLRLDFSINVYESPAVIDAFKGETKSVSETEGYPVTLQTDTETHGDELIVWRFGDEGKLIAKHDLEAKSLRLYNDPDERFRDRLKLNNQTGSLTIRDFRTTDSGVYKVKISSSKQTLYKRFTVTVSDPGLSPGAVAGIVVVLLLVFSAAAAAGVFYYRHKVSELLKRMRQVKTSVLKGRPVTLNYDTEIQKDDKIQWKFEEKLIAEMTGENRENPQWSDEFRDQMKLDPQTGSLIIHQTRPEHSGLYKLEINTSDYSTFRLFRIIVFDEEKSVSVMKGADVTLCVNPEIQTGDKIFWMFGDENRPVAKNTKDKCEEESEYSDDRFIDKVDLNRQTGDLTIKKIKTIHTGEYKLKIIRNGKSSLKLFNVTVSGQVNESVLKGDSVALYYDTDIQKDDKIQWKFGAEEKLIAEMTGENREDPQWFDDKFRDQMTLDPQTGSLFIHRTRPEHSGLYKLEIKTSDYSTFTLFRIIVCDEEKSVSVMRGADVTLRVNTEIQTGDKIFWMFGDENRPVAKNTKEKCEEESECSDVRFKDKVDLNRQTGDLTIKKISIFNTGKYKLKIIRNGKSSFKIFNVTVSEQVNKSVLKGRPVTLNYDTDIQKDDKIQWKFEEKLIAEMTGENRKNPQWSDDEFRGQMKLDPQTGSLTIQQTRPEHSGLYKLEIKTSDYSTFRLFRIIVFDEMKSVPVMEGADVTLHANTEIQIGDKIFWMFGDKNSLVDKNTEEKCEEESEYSDDRFKPNVDLNPQTGDLTIKKIETFHSGEYKLKIIRNGKTSFKLFSVIYIAHQGNKSVEKGDSVTLYDTDSDIQNDVKIQWKFEEKLIAEMTGENRENLQWSDDEFRDQMKLNPQTGSLTIQQTRPEHSGLYKLEIITSDYSTFRLFRLIVGDEVKSVSVMMGEDVTLRVNTEIQTGDKIFWMFDYENRLVAKNTEEKCEEESEYSDDRFKDKVDLNDQTGDLTIKTIRAIHTGKYKLKIIRNGKSSFKIFNVTVSGQVKTSALKGCPVTLKIYSEIQKDDKIQWKFEEKLIAEMTGENRGNPQWFDDEFRDQMTLDPRTGSLTINQTTPEHSGLYKLEIKTSDYSTFRLFRNIVFDEEKSVSVMKGADVTLSVNTEIQRGDKIFWMFGDDNSPIDKNTEEKCEEESAYSDSIFKDKVDLNRQTGDLTIKTTETDHTGEYKLKIIRNGKSSFKIFRVTVSDQVKTSALKGCPVILYYDTDIQKDDKIQWKFEEKLIAEMTGENRWKPQWFADDEFRDQMKLDPRTGSLIIQQTTPEHSGLYKLEINNSYYSTFRLFSLIVFDEMKSVPVMEGADVTLHANTEIQIGDKIFWMSGDKNSLVDKNTEEKCEEESAYSDDRFKPNVDLNPQTGDLTIKKIRTIHSGEYKLKIIRNGKTSFKLFSVIYIAHQGNKSVEKGDSVTLYDTDSDIQNDVKIQWKFEEKLIAEMTGENPQWSDDEFRDQMKLNPQTGSLTIQQTRPEHSGLYKLEIITSDYSTFRLFRLIVGDEVKSVSVMMGEDVTLRVNTEIQTGDKIFWMFDYENRLVAKNTEEKCEEESEYSDDRFKDKVDLNDQTGDLTIKTIRTDHTGKYKLKIIRNGKSSFKIFNVTVSGQVKTSALKGRSVTLKIYSEIQKDDKIQWKFEEKLIAEMTGENRGNPQWFDDEFRDQMTLDPRTGSLTINQTTPEHSGLYKLEIKTSDHSTFRLFRNIVFDEEKSVSVMKGVDVTLSVNTEIQRGDKIFWMFGDDNSPIDKNTEEKCEEESAYSDSIFKDKVDLNRQTGDLTIKTTETDHTGEYKLKIIRNGKSSFKLFNVTVSAADQVKTSALKGCPVILYYDTDIQKDDKIQWKFEEKLIAEMTGENRWKPQWFADDEFRDQMTLDPRTGSLIIQQTRPEHSGLYKLEIKTSDHSTFRLFRNIVFDEQKSVSVMKGADVTLRANTKIQTGDKIFWMFGDDNSPIDKNTEEKYEEESEYSDVRFKDNVDLNRQTGDLTIKKIETDHTGEYKLKIISNGKSSFKIFSVTVSGQVKTSALKGRPVTLKIYSEIQKDDKIQWKFEEKLIAEMTGENRGNPQWFDDEFRDQMTLDPRTGSLTINQTTPEHSGLYKLEIKTSDYSTFRLFRNIVFDEEKSVSVMKGADVTLSVNTEIQRGDKIFWMFGDDNSPIDKNTEEKCEEESAYSDSIFKDKVDLNRQTGDLTIKTTETDHTGEYKLKIIRNGKSSFKIFRVTVSDQVKTSALKGCPVILYYDTDIQKDDKIQWKFEEKLIAEMTGENRWKPQWFADDEFRDQMKLDPRTGSLIIQQTTPEHSGLYKLEINNSYYSTFRLFSLIVFDEEERKPSMKDSTEKRENESVTVVMPLLKAEDLDGVNEQESLL